MMPSRREFIQLAAAMGAVLAWGGSARASRSKWREARSVYPEGVASGDPDPSSVILWTRRPFSTGERQRLTVEVAEDENFRRVVARASAPVSPASDWTARVLVGGLKPATTYWYRFTDAEGNGSRIGRTRTAPRSDDDRPVNFAFVSCQGVNEGKMNGYRRMIFEDEGARLEDQLDFVLHLGDFIYEIVQYPEDGKPRFDRKLYEVARIPDALTVGPFHIPTTVEGYRAIWEGQPRRAGQPGCPAPVAVCLHLGQSRIFLAGLAEHPEKSEVRAARANDQGRCQPGLVRIYSGAGEGSERSLQRVRLGSCQKRQDRDVRR
jgi:alkaline phosphatase D